MTMIRNPCELFGFIETPVEESILIFHSCSSNLNVNKSYNSDCKELHIGNVPRSIMSERCSRQAAPSAEGSGEAPKDCRLTVAPLCISAHRVDVTEICRMHLYKVDAKNTMEYKAKVQLIFFLFKTYIYDIYMYYIGYIEFILYGI